MVLDPGWDVLLGQLDQLDMSLFLNELPVPSCEQLPELSLDCVTTTATTTITTTTTTTTTLLEDAVGWLPALDVSEAAPAPSSPLTSASVLECTQNLRRQARRTLRIAARRQGPLGSYMQPSVHKHNELRDRLDNMAIPPGTTKEEKK